MNIYFLVEGNSEAKIYPRWLAHLLPEWQRVEYFDAVIEKNYYLFNAKGYPAIIGIHLQKAIEDAEGYDGLLEQHGFDVTLLLNGSMSVMRIELARFYDAIEPGDTVVFVYSGHGWSDGALNYLVPADTPDISSTLVAAELSIPLKNTVPKNVHFMGLLKVLSNSFILRKDVNWCFLLPEMVIKMKN